MMNLGNKVIYQLYPKSFYDSDGDGVGDLRGIIAKMAYLKSLHVDMIWLNPFFVSPQNDNGYDIADYRRIDPRFGTMADFDDLMSAMKAAHIDIMLDMVFNHTSIEHEWFKKALAGDPKYQAYYYIRPPKSDGSLPTNWQSKFGGPAWAPFGKTGKYYLHLYDVTQADLDWHNPQVRHEAAAIVNFWRKKGVRGFRFDVLNVIGKSEKLRDAPPYVTSKTLYTDTSIVERYIKELSAKSFGQEKDSLTVGEMSSTTLERAIAYTKPDHDELKMVFQFHHLKTDYVNGDKWTKAAYSFPKLRETLNHWTTGLAEGGGWQALFWNNHDQPRAINRFGDVVHYRVKSAQMLAASLQLSRGTPYIYMGEEIGMTNPDYTSMSDYVDVEAHNAYQMLLAKGKTKQEAFDIVRSKARDDSRTPMQWDASENAGFTTGKPWLRPTNQKTINVQEELTHGQIFSFYQKLIQLRRKYDVIANGDYHPFRVDIDWLYGYTRNGQDGKLLVLNNFASHAIKVPLPAIWQHGKILITNENKLQLKDELELPPFTTVGIYLAKEG